MQGAPRTGGQPRRVGGDETRPGAVSVQRDRAVHGIVLGGRGQRRSRQVGQSGQGRGDGVSLGGGLVLTLVLIDEGDLRL